jgi:hypothetical protein
LRIEEMMLSPFLPRQREGIACHRIDGEAVLYDLAHHTLHYLNQTASFIWDRCDGRTQLHNVVKEAAGAFGVAADDDPSREALSTAVLSAVADLRANGVLEDALETPDA